MAYEPSKALRLFNGTMTRSLAMLDASTSLCETLAPNPRPAEWTYNSSIPVFADMGRAAVVTAVAAFDDYHTRRFAEAVVPYLKKKGPTNDLVKIMAESGVTLADALRLLTMERPHRRIRTHIDKYLADYTTQRFSVIDELFGALGIKDFSVHVERKAKRKRMRRSIEILVSRRHEIVHGGDLSHKGRLQDLDPDDAKERIMLMDKFVKHADEIVHRCIT